MLKTAVILLTVFVGAWSVVQAEDTGGTLIGSYAVEQNLGGSDVDEMWVASWECYRETYTVTVGAELSAVGISYEKAKRDLEMDDDYARLIKIGYEYRKPTDINIGQLHAKCLNDAHKKITTQ